MWNITYLGPVITIQCPKTMNNLSYYWAEISKIVLTVSITAVSRALAKLDFLGQIRHSKFERLLFAVRHWTMTAALTDVLYHISKDNCISLITYAINCQIVDSDIVSTPSLGWHWQFERLIINWGGGGQWTVTAGAIVWYFIFLKENNLV